MAGTFRSATRPSPARTRKPQAPPDPAPREDLLNARNLSGHSSVITAETVSDPCEIVAARPGDDRALAALLASERTGLLAFLRRLCGGQDAEDVLQETMERIWRYRKAFDPDQAPKAWLFRSAFRTFLDHRKRRQRLPETLGQVDLQVSAPDPHTADLRDQLRQALSALNPTERDILLRFHRNAETLAEIARALHMPVNTVKSHLHRARLKLTGTGQTP